MAQWGYKSSIYSPISKAWVLLRKPYSEVQALVESINAELQTEWLFGKEGFVDYWKNPLNLPMKKGALQRLFLFPGR